MLSSQQLKSTQILDDCQRSLDLLEKVPDGDKQLFRIYWTFCLVALRRVRDALEKYDIVVFPEMRESYERRKTELRKLQDSYHRGTPFAECPQDYLIYHRLIHGERNVRFTKSNKLIPIRGHFLGRVVRLTLATSISRWVILIFGAIGIAAIGFGKGLIGGREK